MSSTYDRYDRGPSRRRGVLSHWVPLILTVTVATVGVAAWIWSQRNNEEEEEGVEHAYQDLDYENADYGDNPAYGATNQNSPQPPPSFTTDPRPGETGYGTVQMQDDAASAATGAGGSTWGSKMSGALRRTSSPQHFLGSAGKTVAAGVAAAGAAVGSALASIREDDKTAYADHETWSEEADAKKDRPAAAASAASAASASKGSTRKRKTVAIVVSADSHSDDIDEDGFLEHAVRLPCFPARRGHVRGLGLANHKSRIYSLCCRIFRARMISPRSSCSSSYTRPASRIRP